MDDSTDTQHDTVASVPWILSETDRLGQQLATTDAQRLFLGLDFDGTLAPHVDEPSAAEPTAENQELLRTLSRQAGVDIAVISGRALDDVRDRVGIDGVEYAGNHGLELDGASPLSDPDATRAQIRTVCDRLETEIDHEDCAIENKGITATVHYRRVDDEESKARIRSIVETVVEDDASDLRCTRGANIVEIRPAIDWDKGEAVQWFVDRRSDACLPMYIGDDTTDEDVFRAIAPDGIGVHVGTDGTAATYRVADVEAVTAVLQWLADAGVDELVGENNSNP
ncbi:trehalose-phosphatase [Halocatena pleomorpha]|uniref:Trehalose 6-phosphate phosphatase n=1 Tax=Halocatena pleomorpha TaxID=1785090 RepID=A0A3P3R8J1_9EURY|nr:trehalose-phosphatase [Halocatena pleomorpha]RRJ28960.1 trehalose-phosphatase [Halocatena pleomorpha]